MSMLVDRRDGVFVTRALEIHVAHVCNLHCDGCKHYSNYNHKGMLSPDDCRAWLGAWSKRIQPKKLRLLGGEPTLNPDLVEIIRIARAALPDTVIQMTTNGFFLDRHPGLLDTLIETRTRLAMTLHSQDADYLARIGPIREGLEAFHARTGANLLFEDVDEIWVRHYKGDGAGMRPYNDGDARRSWVNCQSSKFCMQLHENRLWKCPPIAYLRMQLDKFGLSQRPDWSPYLGYAGIGLEASDRELEEFLSREEESICAMCPAKPPRMPGKSIAWKPEYRPAPQPSA